MVSAVCTYKNGFANLQEEDVLEVRISFFSYFCIFQTNKRSKLESFNVVAYLIVSDMLDMNTAFFLLVQSFRSYSLEIIKCVPTCRSLHLTFY